MGKDLSTLPSRMLIAILAIAALACNWGDYGKDEDEDEVIHSESPSVEISLGHVDYLSASDELYAGEPITFVINAYNNSSYNVLEDLHLAFRLYSPDGAEWGTVVCNDFSTDVSDAMTVSCTPLTMPDVDGEVIVFGGHADEGAGLPTNFSAPLLSFTIGPIDESFVGKTICLTRYDTPEWEWTAFEEGYSSGSGEPEWPDEQCFVIGPPRPHPQIWIDNLDDYAEGIVAGQIVALSIGVENSSGHQLKSLSLGFRIYPKGEESGVTWTSTSGAFTDHIAAEFEYLTTMPHEDPGTVEGLNGYGADTIGFVPWGMLNDHDGLEPDWSNIAWTIYFGPIGEEFIDEKICIDSSWFRPSHKWFWEYEDGSEIKPTWYVEPIEFKIIAP